MYFYLEGEVFAIFTTRSELGNNFDDFRSVLGCR